MEISGPQGEELMRLLKECTANVQVDGKSRGAATFVSSTLLLTSDHVVKDCVGISVVSSNGHSAPATIVTPNPGEGHDLALLRVAIEDSDPEQPAVLLDDALEGEDFYVVGYPAEQNMGPGQEGFSVKGHDRTIVKGVPVLLQIDAGKTITFGMSGGPVLNLRTGAVVGVVRTSKDPMNALGGGAIPMNVAFDDYAELSEFGQNAPVAVQRWRNVLGPELWRAHGQAWELATEIDIVVGGRRNAWEIKSKLVSEEGVTLSASDLGADLTEAMFRWAQRRRLSTEDEVNLLGRLLAKGLFPPKIERHLRGLTEADSLTIRLHVDSGDGLEDIPWELTSLPASKLVLESESHDRTMDFVAANPRYRLLRVDDRATPNVGDLSLPEHINVLGVIGLPFVPPMTDFDEELAGWPPVEEIQSSLAGNFDNSAYVFEGLGDELKQLQKVLETGRFDILHYIGTGSISADRRRAQVRMADFKTRSPLDVQDLFRWARDAGVRLVILQLAEPPRIQGPEPLSVSSLGEMLGGGIEAVLFTRFPVHPRQIASFNYWFYSELKSKTVEQAVQEGRRRLCQTPLIDDWAAFGAFALITNGSHDMRLISPRIEAPDRQPRHSVDQRQVEQAVSPRRPQPSTAAFSWKP